VRGVGCILEARADIKAKLGEQGHNDRNYLSTCKIELDILMLYFGSYWTRRRKVFDRQKTEELFGMPFPLCRVPFGICKSTLKRVSQFKW
jgi:hypothetical protein